MTKPFLTLQLAVNHPVIRYLGDGRVIWWDRDEDNKPNGHALLACRRCDSPNPLPSGTTTPAWNCEKCGSQRLSKSEVYMVCPWCSGKIQVFTDHTGAATLQECLVARCDWIGPSNPAMVPS